MGDQHEVPVHRAAALQVLREPGATEYTWTGVSFFGPRGSAEYPRVTSLGLVRSGIRQLQILQILKDALWGSSGVGGCKLKVAQKGEKLLLDPGQERRRTTCIRFLEG